MVRSRPLKNLLLGQPTFARRWSEARIITGMSDVTALIRAAGQGTDGAMDELYRLLYGELRQIAHAKLRGGAGPTLLNTTALVHESYLRFIKLQQLRLEDRSHFLAYAARVMRSVVVDLVRESRAERRGGDLQLVTYDTAAENASPASSDEALEVHEALAELESIDPRLVRIVEMRYFVGLEMDEIAQALGLGKRTVERDWEKARSFLYASLKRG